ncbi:MAG: nickel-dependent lactate racemase [Bacteroidota bacterium]
MSENAGRPPLHTKRVELPYGDDTLAVDIPADRLIGVFTPNNVRVVHGVASEIRRALANPIGQARLRELASGRKKVTIVTDDNTRPTPVKDILPIVLEELQCGGIGSRQIRIVIALGTHRPMTEDEIDEKLGASTRKSFEVVNHVFDDDSRLVAMGVTSNGTPVHVNRLVAESDFKIGIGSIVPHHIAGFSGGSKIVQPGICGAVTTGATHLLATKEPMSYLGEMENLVRREMDEIARRIGFNTVLNTVLDRKGRLVQAVFGDIVQAFRRGAETARRVYGVRVPELADVVIAGSHPCDLDFWQAHKALYAAARCVNKGGVIILATPCHEGVARTHADMVEYAGLEPEVIQNKLSRGEITDVVAAALAIAWGHVRRRARVLVVSQGIPHSDTRKLGFMPHESLEGALKVAFRLVGVRARVSVLTHAGDTLPLGL